MNVVQHKGIGKDGSGKRRYAVKQSGFERKRWEKLRTREMMRVEQLLIDQYYSPPSSSFSSFFSFSSFSFSSLVQLPVSKRRRAYQGRTRHHYDLNWRSSVIIIALQSMTCSPQQKNCGVKCHRIAGNNSYCNKQTTNEFFSSNELVLTCLNWLIATTIRIEYRMSINGRSVLTHLKAEVKWLVGAVPWQEFVLLVALTSNRNQPRTSNPHILSQIILQINILITTKKKSNNDKYNILTLLNYIAIEFGVTHVIAIFGKNTKIVILLLFPLK